MFKHHFIIIQNNKNTGDCICGIPIMNDKVQNQ